MNGKNRSLKVGGFVLFAMVLATFAVFLIGDNRRAWDRKMTYHARFNDVVGLKSGSAVRMGGIDVGSVSDVSHSDKADDSKIYVTISVARNEARRVRPDTVARVVNKGLLGDKMIDLAGGDPSKAPAPDDSVIASEEDPSDMGKAIEKMTDVAKKADLTMDAIKRTSEQLSDPQMTEDIKGSVRSLRAILDGVANNKDGAAHKMIFDPEEGRRIDHILSNLDASSANLAAISSDAKDVTARAKSGPGLVHTLVYDDQLGASTTGTMVELNKSLVALRTGNGLGHAIVYGDDNTQHVLGNVSAMSDDLREIVANVKAGRGTLGALLVDPSVYEDIKSLVGNVERNQVLRALVRYSIKQNEGRPHAEVKDPVREPPQPLVAPKPQPSPQPGATR
ncbi:MAG: Mce family protein [Myxococcaceae bacterium]|nr:Mce family protein [Myxococcaceae bacterium]